MSIVNINRNQFQNLPSLILKSMGSLSILLLLLHNQNIIHISHTNILYYITIISIVQLIYSIIIYVLNLYVSYYGKDIKLQKNHLSLIFNILKIFGLFVLLNKIYKNNSEYILLSEVFLYFLLYFLISYIITYSKFLIFKTEFFKGISILNIFNLYRLRASNISNINTGENNENTLDIKENIDIEPIIANNETNIGVHIHAENIIKQGIETVGKTIESGIAQAVPQIGLASAIGAGLSAGVKISAGQPLMARVLTTTGLGLAGAGIQVGATAQHHPLRHSDSDSGSEKNALNQLPSNQIEVNIETPPSMFIAVAHHSLVPYDSVTGAGGGGFINSSDEEILNNPVELLLYSIWVLQFVILIFLIVLLITFISKLILSFNFEFNWLNKILSAERSVQVRNIILKYLNFVSKIRELNIIVLIIVLIIISLFSLYFFSVFLLNLEGMCKLYLKYVK